MGPFNFGQPPSFGLRDQQDTRQPITCSQQRANSELTAPIHSHQYDPPLDRDFPLIAQPPAGRPNCARIRPPLRPHKVLHRPQHVQITVRTCPFPLLWGLHKQKRRQLGAVASSGQHASDWSAGSGSALLKLCLCRPQLLISVAHPRVAPSLCSSRFDRRHLPTP